jgi:hypothetical protein
MTPIILLMGYPPPVAIGTDLLYAGLTKAGGMVVHHQKGNVLWRTVLLMAAGSLPVTLLLNFWLLDADIHALLLAAGFKAYHYSPQGRSLTPLARPGAANTLYCRDLMLVEERLRTAAAFTAAGRSF